MPEPLRPLAELTANLGWLFDHRVIELFRSVDEDAIKVAGLDPLGVLNRTSAERLEELAGDVTFVRRATTLRDELRAELSQRRWPGGERLPEVAYFSPEFGLAASVPQYSGGLGVLAGDHLKAAADLGVPITGVGLFYRSGYFRQVIDESGRQSERFPWQHPAELALRPLDATVAVPIAGQPIEASIWEAAVGANRLLLLDTAVPGESRPDQLVNDRLYGGGSEERIRQELLLGVGGRRALAALGIAPEVYHLNEGHAGFLTLELIRESMAGGLSFEEAVEVVRGSMLFTTHTPVPAGIDRFPRDMVVRHFQWWCDETGVPMDTLLALGSEPAGDPGVFNLAHMSLRLCGDANGVARLHGRVSRQMFSSLWPGVPEDEVPIGSVTNGVHAPTFMTHKLRQLLDETVGRDWRTAPPEQFRAVHAASDQDLWDHRNSCRADLVRFVRHRAARRYRDVGGVPELLDPAVLTIGFARRFATYKRGALLLTDPDRLRAMLLSAERPVQLVFAGKAHPADDPGKGIVQRIAALADDPELRLRVVFVEDYDLDAGRQLTRGVDVWLNTPIRPMEACGTSGMKAALNGVLNVSVLDGWWDEGYRSDLGWAIPTADHVQDPGERDRLEAGFLYELLERDVIPAFYERNTRGVPTGWTSRMAACLEHLVPRFQAARMVREYVTDHYIPAAEHAAALRADDARPARELATWRAWMTRAWPAVQISSVAPPLDAHPTEEIELGAEVRLGELRPQDVVVEYVLGPVDIDGRIEEQQFHPMEEAGQRDGTHHYRARLVCDAPGTMGVAVRVRPHHPAARRWTEFGLVRWAD